MQITSVSSLITIFVSETVMKERIWHGSILVIDFTFSLSANWQKLRCSLCVPFCTHIFKRKKMTARAEARSAGRAEAFQPGHLTWRALALRRHCRWSVINLLIYYHVPTMHCHWLQYIYHLHIFMHAAIALQEPARLLQTAEFILFDFIVDICTCAINAAIYFIAAFFYRIAHEAILL